MSTPPIEAILQALREYAYAAPSHQRTLDIWMQLSPLVGTEYWDLAFDYVYAHKLLPELDQIVDFKALECAQLQHEAVVHKTHWLHPVDGSEMIPIPAGPFFYGSENQREELPYFSVAKHPVTQSQYRHFLKETGYTSRSQHNLGWMHRTQEQLALFGTDEDESFNSEHPAVSVSWIDAHAYCAWIGLTLPTEMMWEKAARGVDGRMLPWGTADPLRTTRPIAQVNAHTTCPVTDFSTTRTAYGCQNMVGNVREWTLPNAGFQRDITHEKDIHYVPVRGASFSCKHKRLMYCTYTSWFRKNYISDDLGFRLAYIPTFKQEQKEEL